MRLGPLTFPGEGIPLKRHLRAQSRQCGASLLGLLGYGLEMARDDAPAVTLLEQL